MPSRPGDRDLCLASMTDAGAAGHGLEFAVARRRNGVVCAHHNIFTPRTTAAPSPSSTIPSSATRRRWSILPEHHAPTVVGTSTVSGSGEPLQRFEFVAPSRDRTDQVPARRPLLAATW